MTDCLCTAGHEGEIETTESVCDVCALGTYKGIDGPGVCTDCPGVGVITAATASTVVTDCLCVAGYFGEILATEDECEICEIGTYKEAMGIADACEVCPVEATTAATGSTAVTDCLCVAGFTGLIDRPASLCVACEAGTYKEVVGPADCTACTGNADTATPGSDSIGSCRCLAGYGREGDITGPEDTCDACPVDEYKAQPANVPCSPCPPGAGTGGATGATVCQAPAPAGCCMLPTSVVSTTYDGTAPFGQWSFGHSFGWEGNAYASVQLRFSYERQVFIRSLGRCFNIRGQRDGSGAVECESFEGRCPRFELDFLTRNFCFGVPPQGRYNNSLYPQPAGNVTIGAGKQLLGQRYTAAGADAGSNMPSAVVNHGPDRQSCVPVYTQTLEPLQTMFYSNFQQNTEHRFPPGSFDLPGECFDSATGAPRNSSTSTPRSTAS
eukprot:SAG22_NODE_1175_length_5248_cov_5.674694_4_plen_439_part_00